MASPQPPQRSGSTSSSSNSYDQLQWVINIRRVLEQEIEEETEFPISIFNVSKNLMSNSPDSYNPQLVSFGPYHHSRLDLQGMHRYKVSAAKRTHWKLQRGLKFSDLVEHFLMLESKIRGCYNSYITYNGEKLAWMLSIDASFLLELLQISAFGGTKMLPSVTSSKSHFLDHSNRRLAYHAILRDMVMLENQIPLFLLEKVLEFQFPSQEAADDMLFSMLMGTCKELSPFRTAAAGWQQRNLSEHTHLLDFLYHLIVPKVEVSIEIEQDEGITIDHTNATQGNEESSSDGSIYIIQLVKQVWTLLSNLNFGPLNFLKKLLPSILQIFNLLWTVVLRKILGIETTKLDAVFDISQNKRQPQFVEEIKIPSITQLNRSGIRFVPTNGSISTINFDEKARIFYLPRMSIDMNSEVVLRNLVAYEEANGWDSMVFTRYTDLMNGIIDTGEDVKLLRDRGIILNHLKNDKEVANMWNGMRKSIRLTKVAFVDKVIEDVNKYYDGRLKVKVRKFMKYYVVCSWKLLGVVAVILLLLLWSMQAFCSVYDCVRTFHIYLDSRSIISQVVLQQR